MRNNYGKITKDNLERLYGNLPGDLENKLPGEKSGLAYSFTAFGQSCILSPSGITLRGFEAWVLRLPGVPIFNRPLARMIHKATGRAGILPVLPNHRLEACAASLVDRLG